MAAKNEELRAAAVAAREAATAKPDDAALAAAATAAEEALAKAEAPAARKLVPVRILIAHGDHQPNDVAEIPADEVADAEAAGWADSDKTAVAYARKLAQA